MHPSFATTAVDGILGLSLRMLGVMDGIASHPGIADGITSHPGMADGITSHPGIADGITSHPGTVRDGIVGPSLLGCL